MRQPLAILVLAAALVAGMAAPAAAVELVRVGSFAAPTFVAAPPGDHERLFVVERAGTIRIHEDGRTRAQPFLDISSRVSTGGERGLLSMAFAPDYADSGRFFVFHTDRGGDVIVAEYRRSASDPNRADPSTRRVRLRQEHSARSNHNGGQLQMGPDGLLYVSIGDGGGDGSPAQDRGSFLGKITRMDPAGGRPEVYALGLRNPYRFSFDRQTGELTIGDVGERFQEEVDLLPAGARAGANFGWPVCEGERCSGEPPPRYVAPVLVRPPNEGTCTSLIGGYVVRDPGLAELFGRYVYGDFCTGELRSALLEPGGARDDGRLGVTVASLSSLGEDAAGCVYATSLEGPVYRLARTRGASAGPCQLERRAGGSLPEGVRIAFVRDRQIWTLEASGATRLTGRGGGSPAFSPDGERIAFERDGQIHMMASRDPRRAERLTGAGGADPAFSPDGERIAFERDGQIHVMPARDPRRAERLTGGGGTEPAFSPDGERIAFVRRGQIYVMAARDPRRAERLTGGGGADPAFSPDGRRIAFERDGQIHVMASRDPRRAERLTGAGGADPAFSPDGARIAFVRRGQLWRMAAVDPRSAERLTAAEAREPAYAP